MPAPGGWNLTTMGNNFMRVIGMAIEAGWSMITTGTTTMTATKTGITTRTNTATPNVGLA
jgi:hypothetical protein